MLEMTHKRCYPGSHSGLSMRHNYSDMMGVKDREEGKSNFQNSLKIFHISEKILKYMNNTVTDLTENEKKFMKEMRNKI